MLNSVGPRKRSAAGQAVSNAIPLVFIRAPWIEAVGPEVEVLAERDGRVIAARQGRLLATSFHPELTQDTSVYEYFLQM